jgi:hypothetical protein
MGLGGIYKNNVKTQKVIQKQWNFGVNLIKIVPIHNIKEYSSNGGMVPLIFLTLALDGGEWLTSSPGSITPGTH